MTPAVTWVLVVLNIVSPGHPAGHVIPADPILTNMPSQDACHHAVRSIQRNPEVRAFCFATRTQPAPQPAR